MRFRNVLGCLVALAAGDLSREVPIFDRAWLAFEDFVPKK